MLKSIGKLFTAQGRSVFHPSQKCPECGSRLMRVENDWRCPNLDCPAQIRARIEHWCSPGAMDIAGGNARAAELVHRGLVRDVAELYRLKAAALAALEGMDRNSAKDFLDAIAASRKREAWRLLYGLAIPQVGAEEARLLCEHFPAVDDILDAGVGRLRQVPGISETVAYSIMQWYGDSVNRKLVRRLYRSRLNFKT